jgi:two-component system NarL family sensor kinase
MSLKILIVIFVIVISLIFMGLIVSIIFLNSNFMKSFKVQKKKFTEEKRVLEMQFLEAQIFTLEKERERIANNFHDDINPLLTALKYQLRLFILEQKEFVLTNNEYKQMNDLIDKIIENQNAAIRNLAPLVENIVHLSLSINDYLNCVKTYKVNFESEISEKTVLEPDIIKNMYSIFLELMHNLFKHETLTELNVYLKLDNSSFDLTLNHDGKGLTNEQYYNSIKLKEGRGLSSVLSRLNYIGAKMDLRSMKDGAIIHITLPLKNA